MDWSGGESMLDQPAHGPEQHLTVCACVAEQGDLPLSFDVGTNMFLKLIKNN